MSNRAGEKRTLFTGAILLLVILAAGSLRLVSLETEGFWLDEGYTHVVTGKELPELINILRHDDAPPLYYLIQKLIRTTLNDRVSPEAAARVLPAVASTLGVLALAFYLRKRRTQWPSVLLLSFSSYAVFYGRQARSYGWVLLLIILVVILAQKTAETGRRRAAAGLALTLGVLLWSHNIGLVVWAAGLGAFSLLLVHAWFRRHTIRTALFGLGAHLLGIVLVLPWHLTGRDQFSHHAFVNAWMGKYWEDAPLVLAPLMSLVVYGPGSPVRPPTPANLPYPLSDSGWILCLVITLGFLFAVAIGLVLHYRSERSKTLIKIDNSEGTALFLESVYLAVPLLLSLTASWLWAPTYVLGRTDVMAFPAFILIAGRGLAALPNLWRRGILALYILVSVSIILPLIGIGHSPGLKGNDRELANKLSADLNAGDLVIYTALTAPSLEAYFEVWKTPHAVTYFPKSQALNPADSWTHSLDSLETYRLEALRLRERLESEETTRLMIPVRLRQGIHPTGKNTAEDLVYPQSVLAYILGGLDPLPVHVHHGKNGPDTLRYHQDWVGGDRLILSYRKDRLVDLSTLGGIEVEP